MEDLSKLEDELCKYMPKDQSMLNGNRFDSGIDSCSFSSTNVTNSITSQNQDVTLTQEQEMAYDSLINSCASLTIDDKVKPSVTHNVNSTERFEQASLVLQQLFEYIDEDSYT